MPSLTDYVDPAILQQVQDAFTVAAQVPIRIFSPDDEPLTRASDPDADRDTIPCPSASEAPGQLCSVPVVLGDERLASIRILPDEQDVQPPAPAEAGRVRVGAVRFIRLMGMMISRLCDREQQLRDRVGDLATLFQLTAEFTGQHDLQNVLDLVAQTVARALNAKGCSIRMLSDDHSELLIRAVANLSPEYLEKGPILVSESRIDQEALSTGQPVYIADERTDSRVLYRDEAREEGIVSALVAPLVYKGHPEGVVHVYTSEPYEFDWFEVSLLRALATQAAAAILNARLYDESVQAGVMKRQLDLARDVQRRMIPATPPAIGGMDIGAVYVPSLQLSGDFYDFIDLPPGNLGLAVCDVVGKGVRASLLMAAIRASLRAHAMNVYDMSEVLAKVNRDLCADTLTSDFATLFYGVVDTYSHRFTYANAGHPPPLLLRGGEVCHLSTGGGVIGVDPDGEWGHESMTLASGDVVLACTDGLTDAMNFEDEPFGRRRVEEAALRAIGQGQDAQGIARYVLWEMRRFAGLQTRLDDCTLTVIKVL